MTVTFEKNGMSNRGIFVSFVLFISIYSAAFALNAYKFEMLNYRYNVTRRIDNKSAKVFLEGLNRLEAAAGLYFTGEYAQSPSVKEEMLDRLASAKRSFVKFTYVMQDTARSGTAEKAIAGIDALYAAVVDPQADSLNAYLRLQEYFLLYLKMRRHEIMLDFRAGKLDRNAMIDEIRRHDRLIQTFYSNYQTIIEQRRDSLTPEAKERLQEWNAQSEFCIPNPSRPQNRATQVETDATLDWTDCDSNVSYDVFFWSEGEQKPEEPMLHGLRRSQCAIQQSLKSDTVYFWQIRTHYKNEYVAIRGPVWYFKTR